MNEILFSMIIFLYAGLCIEFSLLMYMRKRNEILSTIVINLLEILYSKNVLNSEDLNKISNRLWENKEKKDNANNLP